MNVRRVLLLIPAILVLIVPVACPRGGVVVDKGPPVGSTARAGLPVTLHRPGHPPTSGRIQSVNPDGTANVYAFVGWIEEPTTGWTTFVNVPGGDVDGSGLFSGPYWVAGP